MHLVSLNSAFSLALATAACFLSARPAGATILTFLNATGRSPDNYGTLGNIGDIGYGDRVNFGAETTGSDANGGYLRGPGGWTPNVRADYRTGDAATGYGGVGLSWGATLDRLDETSETGAGGNGNDANGTPIIEYQSLWPIEPGGTNAVDPFTRAEVILTPDQNYNVVLRNFLSQAYDASNHLVDNQTYQVKAADGAVLFTDTVPDMVGYWWQYYGVNGYVHFNAGNQPIYSSQPIRIIGADSYWYALSAIDFAQELIGDANGDNTVNIFDINLVSSNWSTAGPTGDANHDGTVNIFDINLISANWGHGNGGATAVPEPSTLVTAGLAALALLGVNRRRRG